MAMVDFPEPDNPVNQITFPRCPKIWQRYSYDSLFCFQTTLSFFLLFTCPTPFCKRTLGPNALWLLDPGWIPTNCSVASQLPQFYIYSESTDLLRKSFLPHIWRVPKSKVFSCKAWTPFDFWTLVSLYVTTMLQFCQFFSSAFSSVTSPVDRWWARGCMTPSLMTTRPRYSKSLKL